MSSLPEFMKENIFCCVCGNTDSSKFHLVYQKTRFAVTECALCSHQFIPAYYRQRIEYTQYKNDQVYQAVKEGNNWVKVQRHKLRFEFIKKFIRKGKLFDLGAGWGHFMLAGKELGYDVYGIEIAEQPYRYCVNELKLPVDHIDFFEMKEQEQFDVVTMWDVLEHIDHADRFLEKCKKVTRPGGYLFLQVPQIDSYVAKREKDNWKMMGLDHVNYFSKKTIRQILERSGYEVLEIKSSFEIKLFFMYTVLPFLTKIRKKKKESVRETDQTITAGERQQYFNKLTSRPMWQLKFFVKAHDLLYKSLSALNIGEEMMVAARKIK